MSGGILAAIGVSFLLKYTGLWDYIKTGLSFVQSFFISVFSLLQSFATSAPKFIRIVFFILVFWLFGSFIYNSTLGLTYACGELDGKLYKGSFSAGMGYFFVPPSPKLESLGGDNNFDHVDLNFIDKTGQFGFFSLSLFTSYNNDVSGFIVDDLFESIDDDKYILFPTDYEFVRLGSFVRSPFGTVGNVFGQDNKIKYYICYDKSTGYCYGRDDSCKDGLSSMFEVKYAFSPPDNFYYSMNPSWLNYNRVFSGCAINENDDSGVTVSGWGSSGIVYDMVYIPFSVVTDPEYYYNIFEEFKTVSGGNYIDKTQYEYSISEDNVDYFLESIGGLPSLKQQYLNDFFVPVNRSNDIVYLECKMNSDGTYNDQESPVFAGIPIFEFQFIGLICFVIILLSIISFIRK